MLSRYGTILAPDLPSSRSASAEMQLPSALSDLLIAAPSLSRAPVAPVASERSLPARSTSETRLEISEPSGSRRRTRSSVTVCARDDVAFIAVAAVVLAFAPRSISARISS